MSWEGLTGAGVSYSPSRIESERFGMLIARVVVGDEVGGADEVADDLARVLGESDDDLLVVRWPARLATLGAVAAGTPRRILPADVLTYWEAPADALRLDAEAAGRAGCRVRVPQEADERSLAALDAVVADSFRGYGNHYTANPALDPELALLGYQDWSRRSLLANPGDVVLLEHVDVEHAAVEHPQPDVVGVATLAQSQDGHDLEILLAGLVGGSQGQGWYSHLLGGVGDAARRRGASRVVISTQVHNIRVQRAWARAGFKPYAAVTTVHAMR